MSGFLRLVQKVFPCCPCAPELPAEGHNTPNSPRSPLRDLPAVQWQERPSWPKVNNTPADGSNALVTLMQNKKNPVHANASLLMGSSRKFNAAIADAAKTFGTEKHPRGGSDLSIVDVGQEVPVGELPKVAVRAAFVLNPAGADDWGKLDSYKNNYKKERLAGVAKLSGSADLVYILPPVPQANEPREDVYSVLGAANMPKTPGHAMIGLVVTSAEGMTKNGK